MSSRRDIRLPSLSATMEEATLIRWIVEPGATVAEGEPIAEVGTDKVDMELESPFAGTIVELLAGEGDTVPLGGTLAIIETDVEDLLGGLDLGGEPDEGAPEESVEESPEPDVAPQGEPEAEPAAAAESRVIPAVPPARVLARRLGIDLADVEPTGVRGQITSADVERAAAARQVSEPAPAAAPAPAAPPPPAPPPVAAPAAAPPAAAASAAPPSDRREKIRRATAEIMSASAAIPQFIVRRQLRLDKAAGKKDGRSWTTEIVRALAAALRQHPELNARWDTGAGVTVPLASVAVGLAVDRPGEGLVVATVADPDLLDPADADAAIKAVVDRARTGKLRPEDLAQASISVSNLGAFGVDDFDALLFPPQPAILSVGSIARRPVATSEGALTTALTVAVGLTVDHRVADGADGARVLATFAELVEG